MKQWLLAISLLLIHTILSAQNAGLLDNSFGTNGVVTTTITAGQQNAVNKLLEQPDGKIVAIGSTNDYFSNSAIVVMRFNTDGTFDNTFGTNGISSHNPGTNDAGQTGILQPDGKIIIAGIKDYGAGSRAIVMRLNSIGSIDNSFDDDGVMEIGPSTGADNRFVDIGKDASGNYFLCGQFTNGVGRVDIAVVKLSSLLAIDNSFGNLGIAQFSTGAGYDNYPGGIAIQADGKIVGAGYTAAGSIRAPLVWRMTTSGGLDNSFPGSGWFHYSFSGTQYFTDVAIQSTGRIIAAGFEFFAGVPRVFCKAFDINGTEVTLHVSDDPAQFTLITHITLQTDDQFLLTGYTTAANFHMSRYNVDGYQQDINPDPTRLQLDTDLFSTGDNDYGFAPLIQENGKYVLAGSTGPGTFAVSGSLRIGLVRFAGLFALPVRLLYLRAEKNSGQVLLSWKTGSEENTNTFIIERSSTGNVFTALGSVAARHGSNGGDYSFTDPLPLQATGFYRLKMTDRDGRSTYSKVIAMKPLDALEKMTLFPNPAIDYLYIQTTGIKGNAYLTVVDALGRLMKQEQLPLTGNNSFSIDLRSFPKGDYYITVSTGEQKQTRMVSKY